MRHRHAPSRCPSSVVSLVLATRSRGKLAELVPLLAAHGVVVRSLDQLDIAESDQEGAIEAFDTFDDNARAKAEYFARLTGEVCLADDSGLCVEALDGAPGVRSRRFALDNGRTYAAVDEDRANREAVLTACWDSGRAPPWRAAYVCVVAIAGPGTTVSAMGQTVGALLADAVGYGGFGYDPLFQSDDLAQTFASVSLAEKAAVSHRARALQALLTMPAVQALIAASR
jgi:XTP/dITP diphosphohydrolase